MKHKSIPILALIAICLFAACKKNYTCKCNVTTNLPYFGTVTADTTYTIEKSTKKNAKKKCEDSGKELNAEAQMLNGSASCSI